MENDPPPRPARGCEDLTNLGYAELAKLPPTDNIIEKGWFAYTPAWSWVLLPLFGLVLVSIVLYALFGGY